MPFYRPAFMHDHRKLEPSGPASVKGDLLELHKEPRALTEHSHQTRPTTAAFPHAALAYPTRLTRVFYVWPLPLWPSPQETEARS